MDYVTTVMNKAWKKQTLNTYLSNMQKAGLIQAERSSYRYRYMAACTKDEYIQRWTQKLVEDSYDNSIGNFVAAFTGGQKLSEEEAEKLRKLIWWMRNLAVVRSLQQSIRKKVNALDKCWRETSIRIFWKLLFW